MVLFIDSRFYCIEEVVTEGATSTKGRLVTNVPELTESPTSGGSKFGVTVWTLFGLKAKKLHN